MGENQNERGTALVWAMLFVVVTSGMIVSHTAFLSANRSEMDARYRQKSLASTLARSGLTDAVSWFQRQAQQPVVTFDPVLNPAGNPPSYDTEDDSVGIVRSFQVRGSLWGRYEVRRADAIDISAQRGMAGTGEVWEVASRGVLYQRNDPNKAFNELPNRIVSSTALRTEMRGIRLTPPANAAVSVDDPTLVTIGANGKINGSGSVGVAVPQPTGPTVLPPVSVDLVGTPPAVTLAGYDASPKAVFGMPLDELRQYADGLIMINSFSTISLAELGKIMENGGLVIVSGDVVLPAGAFTSKGVVWIIDGDLTLGNFTNIRFDGVTYVTGSLKLHGRNMLNGLTIVRGELSVGGGTQTAEIRFDAELLAKVKKRLARYRASRIKR